MASACKAETFGCSNIRPRPNSPEFNCFHNTDDAVKTSELNPKNTKRRKYKIIQNSYNKIQNSRKGNPPELKSIYKLDINLKL